MKDDPIPDTDHILRYIKGTGHQDGIVNGGEFLKKPNDRGTSINWMEAFSGLKTNRLRKFVEENGLNTGNQPG